MEIYVGNLAYATTDEGLKAAFAAFGEAESFAATGHAIGDNANGGNFAECRERGEYWVSNIRITTFNRIFNTTEILIENIKQFRNQIHKTLFAERLTNKRKKNREELIFHCATPQKHQQR